MPKCVKLHDFDQADGFHKLSRLMDFKYLVTSKLPDSANPLVLL